MTHKDIFSIFKSLFPTYAEKVTDYFPTGKGCIRVRVGELNQDFIFTYVSNKKWSFETVDNFLNKGAK